MQPKSISTPFHLLTKAITSNRSLLIFTKNNKKLFGFLRAFDRHINLVLENTRELWSNYNNKNDLSYHEKYIPKLILRGDAVILILVI